MDQVKIGVYEHFNGQKYQVIEMARDSETNEEVVVYRALYNSEKFGNRTLWIRKKRNFLEDVLVDGKKVPRFRFIGMA